MAKDSIATFDGTPGTYKEWKRRINAWRGTTDTAPEKKGLRVVQALKGDAWRCCEHFGMLEGEPNSIANENGITLLMACLEENFGATDVADMVQAFDDLLFHTRRKTNPESETMQNYISRFRTAVRKATSLNIQVPDELVAFLMQRSWT